MAKDPAALLYIDNWLVSTKCMKADERGWYLNLVLHQYDKGELPYDIEELANLADVRISEFERFKQAWEQVLKHKFKQNENGNLENPNAKEIIRSRENFKDKRSASGKIGYIVKFAINELKATQEQIEFIKSNINIDEIDTKNEQVLKQMLEQIIKLYINGNGDKDINKNKVEIKNSKRFIPPSLESDVYSFDEFWNDYNKKVGEKGKIEKKFKALTDKDKLNIKEHIPKYKRSQPDKQFRKNPETYLNNKSWNDEIIDNNTQTIKKESYGTRHGEVRFEAGRTDQGSSTL